MTLVLSDFDAANSPGSPVQTVAHRSEAEPKFRLPYGTYQFSPSYIKTEIVIVITMDAAGSFEILFRLLPVLRPFTKDTTSSHQ